MSGADDWLERLRGGAQQTIAGNALTSALIAAGKAIDPARRWWNLPAKYAAADRIKNEVLQKYPGWNNAGDALRHAELSRRMADEIGPVTSAVAGLAHELENTIPAPSSDRLKGAPPWGRDHIQSNWHGQRRPEWDMDLHNNAAGIRAALLGRPVDPASLQTRPNYGGLPPQPYEWP
jgi:hypothetical protein